MTYDEALAFIHSTDWMGSKPGLSRITRLLELIGDPHKDIKAIHVAGTNGKGSFCSMLDSVLREAGYKTGLFTSPYIEFFEERICVCGKLIPKDTLAEITSLIADAIKKMDDHPTEFEIITAIGFEYFKRKNIDIAIVECGMGGRLDSTNVITSPLLSVITGIALDHTQILGDTIEKIAAEKAGIIKSGRPVLFGGGNEGAASVIKKKALETNSAYFETQKSKIENVKCSLDGTDFDYLSRKNVHLSLCGTYQSQNASNVIEAVDILKVFCGLQIPESALYKGLYSAQWKARFEKLCSDPYVFFDGGHNYEGVCAAVNTVKRYFGNNKIIVISGVLKDKDYPKIAAEISKIADTIFTVTPENSRALSAEEYSEIYSSLDVKSKPSTSFEEAVISAFDVSSRNGAPILCLGSLYSYSSFKNALNKVVKS